MVQQQAPVTPPPPSRHRQPPSRGRIVARRAIALILLVAGLAFIGLFVVQTIGRIGGTEKPKPLRRLLRRRP